jgi:hypothetical protein
VRCPEGDADRYGEGCHAYGGVHADEPTYCGADTDFHSYMDGDTAPNSHAHC